MGASLLAAALLAQAVSATPATGDAPAPVAPPAVAAPTAAPCTDCVPALTPVELVIDAELGSKISTTGAIFPLHLGKPIVIDGREVVPAGAAGEGEVIHAKKAGGMGAAGELVLAAHFVTVDGRPLKLRSMRVAMAGKDSIHTVDTINAASAASVIPIGLVGFFVSGHNVYLPKGTSAAAKTSADFPLNFAGALPAPPTPTAEPRKDEPVP